MACHGAARPACADSRPFAVATYRNAGDSLGQILTLVPRGWYSSPTIAATPAAHHAANSARPTSAKLISALGDGWTAHTVRHRFGTLAYAVERDLRAVQELLGHQKIDTMTVYRKVPDGAMRRAAAASSLVGASRRGSASAVTVRP